MKAFFSRMNPTVRGFLIILAIVGIVVVLQLQATLTALFILARIAFVPRAALALRAEYYDDRDGFFSGNAQVLREGTATLELRPADHLIVKLEARLDVSGSRVFAAERDAAGNPTFSKTQTLAIASAVAEF